MLEKIDKYAFYECGHLYDIVFYPKLKFIGKRAFYKCELLTDISFKYKMEIDNEAFYKSGLKNIVLGNKIKKNMLGIRIFKHCDHIESI